MIRCPACGGNNAKPGHCALCGCYLSPLLDEQEPGIRCRVSAPRPSFAEGYITVLNERFPTFHDVQRYNIHQRLLALEMEDDMQVMQEIAGRRAP